MAGDERSKPDAGAVRDDPGERPDAFVSHAHQDAGFVAALVDGLAAHGKTAWIHRDEVPVAADWAEQIDAAIRAARTFLFVISPDALASRECRRELAQAVAAHKRIIPLLLRTVEPDRLPPELRSRNWISLREGEDADMQLARLSAAIDEDPDWLETHARLAVAAFEWARRGRDAGALLRGRELEAAEAWLADRAAHREAPTDAHRAFVEQSRRAATGRRRVRSAVGAAALLLVAGLATLAIVQRRDAAANARSASALAVAADSSSLLHARPDMALLLAFQAYRLSPTPAVRGSVVMALRAVRTPGTIAILHGHTSAVYGVAFSPDGRTLASSSADAGVRLWDVRTHRQLGAPLRRGLYGLPCVAFSPDGRTVASAANDGLVRLWDAGSHRQVGATIEASPPTDPVNGVAFSPDGRLLATAADDNTVRLWDARTHRQLGHPFEGAQNGFDAVAFSPDGRILAAGGDDASDTGSLYLWDLRTRRRVALLHADSSWVNRIAFSPDSRVVATIGSDSRLRLWSVRSHRQLGPSMYTHTTNRLNGLAFSPDGRLLATSGGTDALIRLWDARTHRQVGPPLAGHSQAVSGLAFGADGRTLASASDDGTVRLWDVRRRERLGVPLVPPWATRRTGLWPNAIAFSPDGSTLAVGGSQWTSDTATAVDLSPPPEGPIMLWDLRSDRLLPGPFLPGSPDQQLPDTIDDLAFGPDGRTLLSTDTLQVWDVPRRRLRATLNSGFEQLALSPDGRLAAATDRQDQQAVDLWDVRTLRRVGRPLPGPRRTNPDPPDHGFAFNPDGSLLAVSYDDATIRLWNVRRHRRVGPPLRGHADVIWSLAFSPDGRTLASGSSDQTIRLWDVRAHRQLGLSLIGHTNAVHSVAFSPDGRTLVSGSWDGTVRLWDVHTHQQIGAPLAPHGGRVERVAFSPDGDAFASGEDDSTVRIWRGLTWRSDRDLRAEVCSLVGDDLSAADVAKYAPGLEATPACG